MRRRPIDIGFSLIELLVAMTIGLVVTLAITSVMIRSEGTKRTHTSVSDLNQTGAFTAFVLDRAIRSAGSGFSQSWNSVFGCKLDVKQGNTATLPIVNAIASTSAFARVTSTTLPVRLAPVIIAKGLADVVSPAQITRGDVLMVMSGTGGVSEVSQLVTPGSVKSSGLLMQSGFGLQTNDLLLLSDPANVPAGCLVEQVGSRSATDASGNVPLAAAATAPSYYTAAGNLANLSQFNTAAVALHLGNTANMPQFQLFGVGPNNALASLDLLTPVGSTAPDIPVADGVVELRALYGLDTNQDGVIDQWVDPGTTGYTAATLLNGSATSKALLRQIIAIRVGMILRSSLQEQDPVIGPKNASTGYGTQALTLTLFSDLANGSLAYTRTYAAGTPDLNYRYRTVEDTIPLRNVLNAP